MRTHPAESLQWDPVQRCWGKLCRPHPGGKGPNSPLAVLTQALVAHSPAGFSPLEITSRCPAQGRSIQGNMCPSTAAPSPQASPLSATSCSGRKENKHKISPCEGLDLRAPQFF